MASSLIEIDLEKISMDFLFVDLCGGNGIGIMFELFYKIMIISFDYFSPKIDFCTDSSEVPMPLRANVSRDKQTSQVSRNTKLILNKMQN